MSSVRDDLLDPDQAAAYCCCSARTIKDYARRDEKDPLRLQGLKTAKGWRFRHEWLDNWMERYSDWKKKK